MRTGGANPNQCSRDDGSTPLLIAAQRGHLSMVQKLAEDGNARVDQAAIDGGTPLLHAAQNGHSEVVEWLVHYGADPNRCTHDTNATPLYLAAQNGHEAACRFLLANGAAAGIDIMTSDVGFTPLAAAAMHGNHAIVIMLIDATADVNKGKPRKLHHVERKPLIYLLGVGRHQHRRCYGTLSCRGERPHGGGERFAGPRPNPNSSLPQSQPQP